MSSHPAKPWGREKVPRPPPPRLSNKGQRGFVIQSRGSMPPPGERWRGPRLPTSWGSWKPRRRAESNCRILESQLRGGTILQEDVQMSRDIRGPLWAWEKHLNLEFKQAETPDLGCSLSTVAPCSHWWLLIFLVSSPVKQTKFSLFFC